MTKFIPKKKIIVLVLSVVFLLFILNCALQVSKKETLSDIYVSYSSLGAYTLKYRIDLTNKELWKRGDAFNPSYNDEPDEGSVIKHLSQDKINQFMDKFEAYDVMNWSYSINSREVLDSDCEIIFVFSDGFQKVFSENNIDSAKWDEMYTDFKDLTGEDILLRF